MEINKLKNLQHFQIKRNKVGAGILLTDLSIGKRFLVSFLFEFHKETSSLQHQRNPWRKFNITKSMKIEMDIDIYED